MKKTNKLIHQASAFCLRNVIASTLCLLSPLLAIAADDTWNGSGTNNYWNITTNWVDLNVPGIAGPSNTSSDVATFAASTNTRTAVDFTSTVNGRSLTVGKIVVNAGLTNTDFRIISSQATSGGNFRIDGVSGVGIDMSLAAQPFSFGTTGSGNDFRVYVQNDQSWDVTSATALANLNLRYSDPTNGITLYLQNMDSSAPTALTVNAGTGRSVVIQGPVTGAGSLIKDNAGTLLMSGTNNYAGATTINAGVIQINNASGLGSTSAGTVVAANASLAVLNGLTLADEPLTLNGQGNSSQNGALRTINTANPTTVSAPITLGSSARIRPADGGQLILTGPITDNGNGYNLTLNAQTLGTIIRVNSESNTVGFVTLFGVTNNAGLITFGTNNAFPTSRLALGGGLFDLNGTDQTFAGLTNGFNPTFGRLTNSSATPSTLTIDWSGAVQPSMTTPIAGNINIVKEGTGGQTLGGGTSTVKHTYSGTTTVNAGFLSLSSDLLGVTNNWIVNTGGTLRGSGWIGGLVTVNSGGTIYPGSASNNIGTMLLTNGLTLNAGSTTIATINPDLAVSNSLFNVTGGTLNYGGTLIIYSIGHTNPLAVGQTFRIFPPGGLGSFAATNFNSIETQPGTTVSFADGLVTVTGTTPPSLNIAALGGGDLQINWSSSFYQLQWQTNALDVGLSNNWFDYPTSNRQDTVIWNNDPSIPCTFFGLKEK